MTFVEPNHIGNDVPFAAFGVHLIPETFRTIAPGLPGVIEEGVNSWG
jgi:hypothetical protein